MALLIVFAMFVILVLAVAIPVALVMCVPFCPEEKSKSTEMVATATEKPSKSSRNKAAGANHHSKQATSQSMHKASSRQVSGETKKKPAQSKVRDVPKQSQSKVASSISGLKDKQQKEMSSVKSNGVGEQQVSAVKSTGSGYYAALMKQTKVKSVSMYGMPQ